MVAARMCEASSPFGDHRTALFATDRAAVRLVFVTHSPGTPHHTLEVVAHGAPVSIAPSAYSHRQTGRPIELEVAPPAPLALGLLGLLGLLELAACSEPPLVAAAERQAPVSDWRNWTSGSWEERKAG